MSKEAFPAQWGRVRVFEVQPPGPEDEGEWSLPWWRSLVFPNAGGEIHHGSRGATLPDTLVVRY